MTPEARGRGTGLPCTPRPERGGTGGRQDRLPDRAVRGAREGHRFLPAVASRVDRSAQMVRLDLPAWSAGGSCRRPGSCSHPRGAAGPACLRCTRSPSRRSRTSRRRMSRWTPARSRRSWPATWTGPGSRGTRSPWRWTRLGRGRRLRQPGRRPRQHHRRLPRHDRRPAGLPGPRDRDGAQAGDDRVGDRHGLEALETGNDVAQRPDARRERGAGYQPMPDWSASRVRSPRPADAFAPRPATCRSALEGKRRGEAVLGLPLIERWRGGRTAPIAAATIRASRTAGQAGLEIGSTSPPNAAPAGDQGRSTAAPG